MSEGHIDGTPCPFCGMPAQRKELTPRADGYLYLCQTCGGSYSIGMSALARAMDGDFPPGLLADVRDAIAGGNVPRVARIATDWHPLDIVDGQDNGLGFGQNTRRSDVDPVDRLDRQISN